MDRSTQLLVEEVGFSVADAIASATTVAGRTVPDDRVGGLAAGNYADFLVLGGDPRDDLGALRDVRAVYRDGERVR